MPDDESVIAAGTPVTWTSAVGYSFTGTVLAGPDDDGRYEVERDDTARGLVHRDDLTLVGEPGEADLELTAEQRESLRVERARQAATSRVSDAMQSVYVLLREDVKREVGEEPQDGALDDLRTRAADLVVTEATTLRDAITQQIASKS